MVLRKTFRRMYENRSPSIDGTFVLMTSETPTQQLFPYVPYIGAPSSIPNGVLSGVCPVCGCHAEFSGFSDSLRESGRCSSCGSTNRQRQIAHMIRNRFFMSPIGPITFHEGASVYNTESRGSVHEALSGGDGYICSEYFGSEYAPGEIVNGVRHEDLCTLSFPPSSLDLVLSSDVMEHIPAPYDAHREIFRVLKPGGRHIFTVPFDALTQKDKIRAEMVDGEIRYLEEKQYHGDPVRPGEGVLVWTTFGIEMMQKLEEIGYKARAWNLYEPDYGIVGNYNLIFEAKKPE